MRRHHATTSDARDRTVAARMLQGVNRLFTRVYHHVDVRSPCRLPRHGRAIIICNHISGLDPQLIQSCCPRLITWMMAAEYYNIPVVRWVLDKVSVIPVTRSGRDMAAMRLAIRALESGQVLGVFPEGRIEETGELLPFQTGVALLAIKTNTRVWSAYLDGTQRGRPMLEAFVRPQSATLTFGPEIMFDRASSDRESLENAADAMQRAVQRLRDQQGADGPIPRESADLAESQKIV